MRSYDNKSQSILETFTGHLVDQVTHTSGRGVNENEQVNNQRNYNEARVTLECLKKNASAGRLNSQPKVLGSRSFQQLSKLSRVAFFSTLMSMDALQHYL